MERIAIRGLLFTTKKVQFRGKPNYVFFAAGEPGIDPFCFMQAESLE